MILETEKKNINRDKEWPDLEFMADSVIQATGTVEFEDGLRRVVLLGGCWGP